MSHIVNEQRMPGRSTSSIGAVTLVLLALCLAGFAAPASAARLFPTWVAASTGAQPSAVATADFNGDGTPDAAVASLVGNSVRVLLGVSDATFGATQDIAVGSAPRAVLAADVNGDGHADLLVACAGAAALDVLLGNGFGGFSTPVAYAAPAGASCLALGDLNHDGALDVVVGGAASSTVSVLFGNGMGAFAAGVGVSVGQPLGVAVGDVDGDGAADVVVADAASSGAVWLQNDGNGGLAAPVTVSTDEDPRAVALYDVDADGDLDVLVGDAAQPAVDVWRNDGAAGFSGPEPAPTVGAPTTLLLADVTGDGRADVIAGQSSANAITPFIADVSGSLLEIGTYGTPTGTSGMAAADADHDGDVDLYVTGSIADAVGLLRNTGGATFGGGMPVGVGLRPVGVALADVNGDHRLDAIVANADGNSITVVFNTFGHFDDAAEFPAGSSPSGVAAGDFDGDGDADLAVADFGSGGVSLLTNDGAGGFTLSGFVATGSGASSVAAADLNGDGAPDLVVSNFNASSVRVLRGNGHGVFTAFGGAFAVGVNPTQIRLADVNGDGALDVVTANDGNSTISVALGTGAAGFGPATSIAVSGGAVAVAAGDLAHDGGVPDLVVANDHSNTVTYLRNIAGALTVASVVPAGRNPLDVQVADLDADGFADVVVTNTLAGTVSVLPGVAGGGLAAGIAYGTGGGSGHVAVGDLSGHHTKDLFITGDPTNGTDAWVLENDKLCPAPVIALRGANPMTVECHGAFVDPGATASDHCDDSVPVSVDGAVNANLPGMYTLTYTAVNADLNAAFPVSRQVRVVDTTPPVLALAGDTLITVTCHGSFTDPGATATDACDASVAVVVSGGPVNVTVPGTYVLTYAAADAAGNIGASVHRTVRVEDSTKPVIVLNGSSPLTVECHAAFTDPGATASDNCDANVAVTVSGSVDTATPGNYVLTYSATDNAGNAATAVTRTVVVHDTTPPVITLVGAASMAVGCAGSFTDPGATAADVCDAAVAVTVSGGPVDVHTVGDYVLTYAAVDAAGNAAAPVTRTVHVANASTPVITVLGDSPATVECHGTFTDPGATALDACEGSLAVTVAGAVNANAPGSYTLTYTAVNAAGTAAVPATRTVNVVDTTPPVVVLSGAAVASVECHGAFVDPGAVASDGCDASVAVTVSGSVNANAAGAYTLTYDAVDASGNHAVPVTRTVNVIDTTPPVIALLGGSPLSVQCHGTFADPGATVTDACDANVAVTVTGSVNANVTGSYTLTYNAHDASVNNAVPVTRTVNVTDSTPPVIALLGGSPLSVQCHGTFADPGATATDNCDANVAVSVSGAVNANVTGSYTLTYTAHDASGNNAVPVTRTVNVTDSTPPVIALLGGSPLSVQCHGTFADPGASATDNCDANVAVAVSGSVNTNVTGAYTLTYTAHDAAGNNAVPVTRTVNVTDSTPPVIALLGGSPLSVQCHGTFADPGATATDNCDANVAVAVSGSVNTNVTGSYTLTYTAHDAAGNNAVPVTRTVNVTDSTPPVIALLGGSPLRVQCHGTFADPGATVTDNCDANVAVTVTGSVNTNVPGAYLLTYNARDVAGNSAVTATRTVNVIDTTVPVITLLGVSPVTVECHSTYTDAGASASDNCDSNVPVCKSGSVNANVVGTYVLTYTATDAAGNFALPVTRTVQVKDTTPPTLTVNTTPITVTDKDCSGSEPVTLPVATATDACDPHPSVTNNAPSQFPAGKTTVVTYTARDAAGNSATANVSVTVKYGGNVDVSSCYYKTGSGCHPTVTKTYNANICVKAYSTAPGSQVRQKYPYGTIDYSKYPSIWATCTPIASGYTDNNGKCSLNVPSNCDYVVVSNFDADHDGHCDDYTGSNVHSSDQCQGSHCSEHHDRCYANYEKDCNSNKRSCTTNRLTGSELLVVQPDYIVWDDSVQVYPYVYESDGDWGVVAAIAPPEGFIADYDTLTADVNNESEAVQFTVEEVGSELVPTMGTLNITHKGRHISLRQPVDIRLSRRYALRRHFDVADPRVQRMLIAVASDTLATPSGEGKKKGRPPVVITSAPATRRAELAVDPTVVAGVGQVHVKLTLPQSGIEQSSPDLDIAVYDAEGRRLATIIRGGVMAPDGVVSVEWNTRDGDTGRLPSGAYFLRAVSPAAKLSLQKRFVVVQ